MLNSSELGPVLASPYMFARKVDLDIDPQVLVLWDKRMALTQPQPYPQPLPQPNSNLDPSPNSRPSPSPNPSPHPNQVLVLWDKWMARKLAGEVAHPAQALIGH